MVDFYGMEILLVYVAHLWCINNDNDSYVHCDLLEKYVLIWGGSMSMEKMFFYKLFLSQCWYLDKKK